MQERKEEQSEGAANLCKFELQYLACVMRKVHPTNFPRSKLYVVNMLIPIMNYKPFQLLMLLLFSIIKEGLLHIINLGEQYF